MDLSQRLNLDELKALAPRTFDKTLIDILVRVQQGQRPIITQMPALPTLAAAYDDTALRDRIAALETGMEIISQKIVQLVEAYNGAQQAVAQLMASAVALDERISGIKMRDAA